MAKKNKNEVEEKAEEETKEETIPEIVIPGEKAEEETKEESTTGNKYFDEHYNRKFYLKGKNQIELNGKIVDKNSLKECPYYENLNEMEIQKFKDSGKII